MEDIITMLSTTALNAGKPPQTSAETSAEREGPPRPVFVQVRPEQPTIAPEPTASPVFQLGPLMDILKTAIQSKTFSSPSSSTALADAQRTKVRHAFAIVNESQNADKFIRVLGERQTRLDSICDDDLSGLLRIISPEISEERNSKLAQILTIALLE